MWTHDIKGARSVSQRAPIVFQDRVIVTMNHGLDTNFQGTIMALDLETGAELWRIDRPHYFSQPVLSPDGSVYVTSFDGAAHKIGNNGKLAWSNVISERNLWSGILHAGMFIFSEIAGGSKTTWALDDQTGDVNWHYENGGHSYGVTADHAGSVVVSSYSGSFDKQVFSLHRVNIETGQRIWKAEYANILFRSVMLQDWVVVGSRGRIGAFSLPDGALVSEYISPHEAAFQQQPIAHGETVIFASDQGHVVALGVETKKRMLGRTSSSLQPIWETKIDSEIEYFALAQDSLIALTSSGHLYKLNPSNGRESLKLKLPRYQRGMGIFEIDANNFITAVNRSCERISV